MPSDNEEEFLKSKTIWKFLSKWIDKKSAKIERRETLCNHSTKHQIQQSGCAGTQADQALEASRFLGADLLEDSRDAGSPSGGEKL